VVFAVIAEFYLLHDKIQHSYFTISQVQMTSLQVLLLYTPESSAYVRAKNFPSLSHLRLAAPCLP